MLSPLRFRAYHTVAKKMSQPFDVFNVSSALQVSIFTGESLPMQSTGREDQTGREIFGDDVVDFKGVRAVVRWDECGLWYFDPVDEDAWIDDWNFQDDAGRCRVIGNVYEHPHLLPTAA